MKRRLSDCERLYWYANAQSPGNVIAVAHVHGAMHPAQLQEAADQLSDIHPLLGVHVVERAPADFWLESEDAPPVHMQVTTGPHDLDAILESELNTRLGKEPGAGARSRLWRARLVQQDPSSDWVAILTLSHMVCDASAMLLALRDWLDLYRRMIDGPTETATLQRWPERPAFDELLPKSFSAPGRALWHTSRMLARLVRAQLRQPLALRARKDVPLNQRTSSVLLRTLPADEVATLHARCREHGITLHGAWMAALTLALRDVVNGSGGDKQLVGFTTPTSLRHLLDVPIGEEVGCYVSMLHAFIDAPRQRSFWELARAANGAVKDSLRRQEHLAGVQLGRWISPKTKEKAERTLTKMAAQGGAGACVSNLGNFSMPPELGSLQLRQVYGFAALSFTGALLFGVLTINRRTMLCISYVPSAVERNVVDQIVAGFCAKLSEQATDHRTLSGASAEQHPC